MKKLIFIILIKTLLQSSFAQLSTPDYLYYKFENNPDATTTPNCADTGVGTSYAPLAGITLVSGGQFDSCISGTGIGGGGLITGWNCDLGTSSWTISMWISIPTTNSQAAYYFFGDPGSLNFRAFHNGVAGPNNLLLRGGGNIDFLVTGIGPAPTVVTFVYDSTEAQITAYKNGVSAGTFSLALSIPIGTGFNVGGFSTFPTFAGKLDEFRLWRRALSASEVLALYNQDLGCGSLVGVNNTNNQISIPYLLRQNYPNPFNPVTKIKFDVPPINASMNGIKGVMVKLVVYDILGRLIHVLKEDQLINPGTYEVVWNAFNYPSGVYYYRLTAGDFTETKKMILIK